MHQATISFSARREKGALGLRALNLNSRLVCDIRPTEFTGLLMTTFGSLGPRYAPEKVSQTVEITA
jgi:hypothetical protein